MNRGSSKAQKTIVKCDEYGQEEINRRPDKKSRSKNENGDTDSSSSGSSGSSKSSQSSESSMSSDSTSATTITVHIPLPRGVKNAFAEECGGSTVSFVQRKSDAVYQHLQALPKSTRVLYLVPSVEDPVQRAVYTKLNPHKRIAMYDPRSPLISSRSRCPPSALPIPFLAATAEDVTLLVKEKDKVEKRGGAEKRGETNASNKKKSAPPAQSAVVIVVAYAESDPARNRLLYHCSALPMVSLVVMTMHGSKAVTAEKGEAPLSIPNHWECVEADGFHAVYAKVE
jgi:hypothetical protein